MHSTLIGLAFAATLALPTSAGVALNSTGDVSEAAQARFEALDEELSAIMKEWRKECRAKIEAAEAAGEERPDIDWGLPLREFIGPFRKAADEYAGTDDAVPFLVWLATEAMREDEESAKSALSTLAEKHAASSGLEPLTGMFPYLGQMIGEEEAASFLMRVESENTSPKIRGWASYARFEKTIDEAALDSEEFKAARRLLEQIAEKLGESRLASQIESKLAIRDKFSNGMVAPDIAGIDLDGTAFKLSDYAGKVVFLDFWGDW